MPNLLLNYRLLDYGLSCSETRHLSSYINVHLANSWTPWKMSSRHRAHPLWSKSASLKSWQRQRTRVHQVGDAYSLKLNGNHTLAVGSKEAAFRSLWKKVKPADKPDDGVPIDTSDAMFSPPTPRHVSHKPQHPSDAPPSSPRPVRSTTLAEPRSPSLIRRRHSHIKHERPRAAR